MSNPVVDRIWFQLYDSDNGLPYKETSVTYVSLSLSSDIAQFRKAVTAEYSYSYLRRIDPSLLKVFKNKESFDKRNSKEDKEDPLKGDFCVDGLGTCEDPLAVQVPYIAEEFPHLPFDCFKECLKRGHISIQDESVKKVLGKITTMFPYQMLAAAGNVDACTNLYNEVKSYPDKNTCDAIQEQMNLSINCPISPKIVTGLDLDTGDLLDQTPPYKRFVNRLSSQRSRQ